MHLLGVLLILAATGVFLASENAQYRCETAVAQELQAALTEMATAIRWHGVTLPEAIGLLRPGNHTERWFRAILSSLQNREDLHNTWIRTFSEVEPPELAGILCRISLHGDREHLLFSLQLAVQQIAEWQRERQQRRGNTRRIRQAAALSAAGLLIILLL